MTPDHGAPGHAAPGGGRPRDAAERQRAVSRLLRPRLALPPGLDRPTTRRLAGLHDAAVDALGTGDHDDLLDDQVAHRWPVALASVVDEVVRRLPPAPPASGPDPTRDLVEGALGSRLGFGPSSPPDSPVLVAAGQVGAAAQALEAQGWSRVVPAPRDDALAEVVSHRRDARAVVTRHRRRVHLEVLPRYGSAGSPGSWLGVLSAGGTIVVVDDGVPGLDPDDLAAFTAFVVATSGLAAVVERNDGDVRLREMR